MFFAKRGHIDKILLATVLAIGLLGVLFVYSATWDKNASGPGLNTIVVKQAMAVMIGLVVLLFIANMDYRRMRDLGYFLYVVNLAALVFLLIFGGERYGARRWINLGFFSLQPSEFVKLTMILALGAFLSDRREKIGGFGNFFFALVLAMPAFALIFLQPDLGTALVLLPILFSILFVCGERKRYLAACVGLGVAALPVLWSLLKDYQKTRLMVFINPNLDPLGAGYTIIQSKIAIGSGGWFGKGWLNGTQSYLKFLPERHSDFIFSVVGEEWGFAGALVIIALYVLFISRGLRIAANTDDVFGKAVAVGVVTLLAFQVFVNISMTIGFMPVVGLPLPAISYGGSSTLATFIGAGLLLSIGRKAAR